ncbi:hypothetical protein LX99_03376 [Mucilaginibacter oryzae]|uniref:Uncharacterized protein n=1 Tax=Mucilaginibacter oryzae TaxID=468058 RepID=A0A316H955_9SPHI|nr:DUF2683 family protein [Mucilaginibacter oryzae]PWK76510.1 hypothetical protein LX99_03376 [Mucilaginibacter oryzae]
MKTLVAHPNTEAQLRAIKAIFEALEVPYNEESELDETDRIMANPAMIKHLDDSIQELKDGKKVIISLDDVWK